MSEKKNNPFAVYGDMWLVFKKNAEQQGKSPFHFFLGCTLKTLSYTIPGFIIVLLFPIKADIIYGWFSGVWHGWFGVCNMVISLFSPNTLYSAPLSTTAYEVWWWICFIYALLLLFGLIIHPCISFRGKLDFHFVAPTDAPNNESQQPQRAASESVRTSIEQRVIKVFISSTFQDMQKERDYLMRRTFPELQQLAARRGIKFVPIDLRWGITEEESKTGKVLELCLQEIDNANPFFIGIIGRRYGWCPTREDLGDSTLLREKYPWIENDFNQHMSVTEIEIQYGVLRRKERINAAFFTTSGNYITAAANDNDEGRMDRLKTAIIMDGRYPLIDVSEGPEYFGHRVYDMYVQYLNQYFPITDTAETPDNQESNDEAKPARQFIADHLARFSKKLSEHQTDTILAHPLCQNRVVLKSLLDELLLFGKFDELDRHIAFLLEGQTPSQFYQKLLECYERQYGKRSVKDFFSIMRLTGYGLKVKDALSIADVDVKADDMDWQKMLTSPASLAKDFGKSLANIDYLPFHQYFQGYLSCRGNVISLNHEWMAQAVDERYLTDEKTIRKYRKKILEEVDTNANTMKDTPDNTDRVEEIAYQLLMLDERDDLELYMDEAEWNDYIFRPYLRQHRPELYQRIMDYLK